jgi:hypothetical protein
MSGTFANSLRARAETIELGGEGERIVFRMQLIDLWDVVRVSAGADVPVIDAKRACLQALAGTHEFDLGHYVVKLNGFEVLDENESLATAGAVNGSTFLLHQRRKVPVRSGRAPLTA